MLAGSAVVRPEPDDDEEPTIDPALPAPAADLVSRLVRCAPEECSLFSARDNLGDSSVSMVLLSVFRCAKSELLLRPET